MRSTVSSAPELEGDVISLERVDRIAEVLWDLAGLALVEVDEHECLCRRDQQQVVAHAIGSAFVRRARASDARDADAELELIVEHRRREVLDRARAHDELDSGLADFHAE